ncbi:MAG: DUF452 family protein [Muribaculaceae bacterium]|nr:DUF452 family protein [Muribaculaceae bacterium]MDE7080265.1 DUF452 family protein [Muribaculaceae bacterium]
MKTSIIARNPSCHRLIIIFSGWSTSPALYAGIFPEGWDVMVVYDYGRTDEPLSIPHYYSSILVVAWSLGVAAAEEALRHEAHRVSGAFAVNGTLAPAHDLYGIPSRIYHDTEAALNERNLRRFRHRLSSSRDPYTFPEESPAAISEAEATDPQLLIARLRTELRHLAPHTLPLSADECSLPWRKAYIGSSDLIFPALNQRRAWEAHPARPQICEWQCGHYIPLDLIISDILPDHTRIRSHFEASHPTYDENATAQTRIAARLAALSQKYIPNDTSAWHMLEIGPGTGSLTRELARRISPAKATFVDLCPLPRFNIASQELYLTTDAEQWMTHEPDAKYDLIASASTIQWFVDPRAFFANAARMLRPGGMLLCSTFVEGNLHELDALRPAPILYRTVRELREMAMAAFDDILIEEEQIPLDFNSPREALMHLKLTGVAGTAKSHIRHLLTSLPPRPRLTYHALYVRAIKN